MEGGAFADSGAPAHARAQRVVDNVRRLADAARARGVVRHPRLVHVEPGAPGVTLNARCSRASWIPRRWFAAPGAAPVAGLEPRPGDFIVEKMRMSAWEGSRLETILKATGRDMLIDTGAWTNMSIEHTAAHRRDKAIS